MLLSIQQRCCGIQTGRVLSDSCQDPLARRYVLSWAIPTLIFLPMAHEQPRPERRVDQHCLPHPNLFLLLCDCLGHSVEKQHLACGLLLSIQQRHCGIPTGRVLSDSSQDPLARRYVLSDPPVSCVYTSGSQRCVPWARLPRGSLWKPSQGPLSFLSRASPRRRCRQRLPPNGASASRRVSPNGSRQQ